MSGDEHNAIAETLVEMAANLARTSTAALVAGELVWGAAIHACVAIAHHLDWRPQHPRQKRELDRLLTHAVAEHPVRADLIDGLNMVQRRLHNHFYTGQLGDIELAQYITGGIELVQRLIDIASQTPRSSGSPVA
ncbi:MAG: hypothetical protein OXF79_13435 [Chloroflexi bacterium]|nr:hypothetical protein [Chloroflexota bacterium]